MKVTRIYKCIKCGHQIKYEGMCYKSPCPLCNGLMIIYITEIQFKGAAEA